MSFNFDYLKIQRDYEYYQLKKIIGLDGKILEIGAGGYQAKALQDDGYDVSAVDLATSNYSGDRVFPVVDYNRHKLPFEGDVFDKVYTSDISGTDE